jgi:CsoR family transcriptional regulator, copper-sensing transcriptional repressor
MYTRAMTKPGYSQSKDQLQSRLSRIEGQVRGVRGMVDEDRYCIDVLTQISAIRAALDRVALSLVDDHARNCMAEASRANDRDEQVDELMGALDRLLTR